MNRGKLVASVPKELAPMFQRFLFFFVPFLFFLLLDDGDGGKVVPCIGNGIRQIALAR